MSSVYKYFPPDRKSFLEDFLIRFSPRVELNDTFECLPAFTLADLEKIAAHVRESIERRHNADDAPEDIREIANEIMEIKKKKALERYDSLDKVRSACYDIAGSNINSGLGILSLSRRWNSSLMWSHYTSSYSGFCVGFNSLHDYFKGDGSSLGNRSKLLSVRYSEKRVVVPPGDFTEEDIRDILLTKSKDWEYEQEERLISSLFLATQRKHKEPYPIDLFKLPSDAVTEIIVGSRMDSKILEFVKTASSALNVKLYQTKASEMTFDIDRIEIEI